MPVVVCFQWLVLHVPVVESPGVGTPQLVLGITVAVAARIGSSVLRNSGTGTAVPLLAWRPSWSCRRHLLRCILKLASGALQRTEEVVEHVNRTGSCLPHLPMDSAELRMFD